MFSKNGKPEGNSLAVQKYTTGRDYHQLDLTTKSQSTA